jgi:hydrogenase nickel incorporation protein HypA/HybF
MHELSIAESILAIAQSEMEKAGATSIGELELEIGKLAGVEYSALDFALQMLTENSSFKNTKIVIQKPDGNATCNDCSSNFLIDSFISQCPKCSSYRYTITSGKELRVKSIVID